jgi:cell wall-associated NlpC family hydrolase
MSSTLSRAAARLLVVPVAASAFLLPSQAHAAPVPAQTATVAEHVATTSTPTTVRHRVLPRGERVIRKARSRAGDPYRYGAAGPHAFDCSGLVQWVYRQIGKRLPRTSSSQAGATRRIRVPHRGDLVFFTSGGHVYHVGIYAGDHMIWHASRPGQPVKRERIWTRSVFYGHVR